MVDRLGVARYFTRRAGRRLQPNHRWASSLRQRLRFLSFLLFAGKTLLPQTGQAKGLRPVNAEQEHRQASPITEERDSVRCPASELSGNFIRLPVC